MYQTRDGYIIIISATKRAYVKIQVHDASFQPFTNQFVEIGRRALAAAEAKAVPQ